MQRQLHLRGILLSPRHHQILFLVLVTVSLLGLCCCHQRPPADLTPDVDGVSSATGIYGGNVPPKKDAETTETRADTTGDVLVTGGVLAVNNVQYLPRATQMIQEAQERIVVVHFECNTDTTVAGLTDELLNAQGRGVAVQVLLENEVEDNTACVEKLTAGGIEARLDTPSLYTHAKLLVVDRQQVLLGSTNWSWKSMLENNETNVWVDNPTIAGFFEDYGKSLFEHPDQVPVLPRQQWEEGGVVTTLMDGDYFDQAVNRIHNADTRVYLLLYALNLDDKYPDSNIYALVDALIAASKRGVDVQIILERSDYNEWLNEMNSKAAAALMAQCVPVRFDPDTTITHAKMLVVDDEVLIHSNNWGYGGLHLYHEIGLVLDDSAAVGDFVDYFQTRWQEATPTGAPCPEAQVRPRRHPGQAHPQPDRLTGQFETVKPQKNI